MFLFYLHCFIPTSSLDFLRTLWISLSIGNNFVFTLIRCLIVSLIPRHNRQICFRSNGAQWNAIYNNDMRTTEGRLHLCRDHINSWTIAPHQCHCKCGIWCQLQVDVLIYQFCNNLTILCDKNEEITEPCSQTEQLVISNNLDNNQ